MEHGVEAGKAAYDEITKPALQNRNADEVKDTVIRSGWHNMNGRIDTLIETYDKTEYNSKGASADPISGKWKK